MQDNSRRALLLGAVGVGVAATTSACFGSSSGGNTGSSVGQNAGSVNDMTVQLGTMTIDAWNAVKDNPGQAYPVDLLKASLELKQQREKLLRFNTDSKPGWLYLFSQTGVLVAQFTIQGKVSSTQSAMTSNIGVYSDGGSGGGGNVAIPLPGDDLSFGPNEGGDSGVFWFDQNGVMGMWPGIWLYLDAPLDVPDEMKASLLATSPGAKPSTIAQGSTLF